MALPNFRLLKRRGMRNRGLKACLESIRSESNRGSGLWNGFRWTDRGQGKPVRAHGSVRQTPGATAPEVWLTTGHFGYAQAVAKTERFLSFTRDAKIEEAQQVLGLGQAAGVARHQTGTPTVFDLQ